MIQLTRTSLNPYLPFVTHPTRNISFNLQDKHTNIRQCGPCYKLFFVVSFIVTCMRVCMQSRCGVAEQGVVMQL
jgi:hypothetical protein